MLAQSIGWMADTAPVAVKPLRTEPQLKRLLYAHSSVLTDDLDPEAEPMLDELRDWLGLADACSARDRWAYRAEARTQISGAAALPRPARLRAQD